MVIDRKNGLLTAALFMTAGCVSTSVTEESYPDSAPAVTQNLSSPRTFLPKEACRGENDHRAMPADFDSYPGCFAVATLQGFVLSPHIFLLKDIRCDGKEIAWTPSFPVSHQFVVYCDWISASVHAGSGIPQP
ncbi:MAG: hypothetical protein M3O22_09035 [Pseudomonadota bacterium]|nr:hypothetical protein [Pseudomonadota bacterium]